MGGAGLARCGSGGASGVNLGEATPRPGELRGVGGGRAAWFEDSGNRAASRPPAATTTRFRGLIWEGSQKEPSGRVLRLLAMLLAIASTVWSTQARAPAQPPPPPRHLFGREHCKPGSRRHNASAVASIRPQTCAAAPDTLPRAPEMMVVVAQAEGGKAAAERLWGETGQTGPPRLLSFQLVTGGVSRRPSVTDSSPTAGARGP